MKHTFVITALLTLVLAVCAFGQDCSQHDTFWAHTYKPDRLEVQAKCVSVTGTIVDATAGKRKDGLRHEEDGDTHGWLQLDPGQEKYLNDGNKTHEGGNLVFEVVCAFPVKQADAMKACKNYATPVKIPPVGAHVRITGSWVKDDNHARWRSFGSSAAHSERAPGSTGEKEEDKMFLATFFAVIGHGLAAFFGGHQNVIQTACNDAQMAVSAAGLTAAAAGAPQSVITELNNVGDALAKISATVSQEATATTFEQGATALTNLAGALVKSGDLGIKNANLQAEIQVVVTRITAVVAALQHAASLN